MKKILVVEDESSIRELIVLNLEMAEYEVVQAASAEEALELFSAAPESFSCAILDIMLPGMNGFTLCENIRAASPVVGIVMLSAKTLEADKVRALSIGADDYMTKPFSITELKARIDALCRRVGRTQPGSEEDGRLASGIFVLDQKSRMMLKSGQPIDLTQVEFQIMELFFRNSGTALVREKILEGVWGENYYGDVKIVDVNIRRLRMKIEDEPSNPKHILTVWGYGYRWNA
ncbi:response regulator transcription factor [Ruminococcaceae bacterium OttesenSCG-928-O06]|nr:response regulator transcription factor [Ruminococcaceae bacterium OttesenSCG-928-O06]